MKLVVFGLSLSSSWGNGHATTYRGLLKALSQRGHDILFIERDLLWYRGNRDIADPDYCRLELYSAIDELELWLDEIRAADCVIVGSYVPQGIEIGELVRRHARGVIAFYDIDTPVTLARLELGDCEYLSPQMIPDYDLYLSFTGGPTLRRIQHEYGSRMVRALYCSVDPHVYRPLSAAKQWDLSYLGTYSEDRQPTLEELLIESARRLPHLKFCVAGPQYPEHIQWPENVERIEHLAPADHPIFYASSRFTLNVTRADMIAAGWSPSVRLFEAAACATPVISDKWDGLDKLFDADREIILADKSDDVVERLSSVSDPAGIGLAARDRILAEHTARHRAEELERYIVEAAERKARSSRRTAVAAAE
jgi:spore maturation protein CgeB